MVDRHRDGYHRVTAWIQRVKIPNSVLISRPFRTVAPKVIPRMHRTLNHLSGGRLFDTTANPMCLLVTTGARSGQRRETPLAVVPLDDDRLLVVGSNFAADHHPAWTFNLLAHPDATVTFRGDTYPVRARLLTGEERDARCDELLAWYPNWRNYSEISQREFRIFELSRV